MTSRSIALLLASAVPLGFQSPVWAEVPLIPRAVLFGNPERQAPTLSPDGQRLAFVAPDAQGVPQVWVQPLAAGEAKPVTADRTRGVKRYRWAEDNRTLLFEQDANGDENFHLFGIDLVTGKTRDYTPQPGVQAVLVALDAKRPNEALVSLNLRDRTQHDVYRLRLDTGALTLDTPNPGDVTRFGADNQLRVRLASATTRDGGTELRVRASEKAPWKLLLKAGPDETVEFESFSADGGSVVLRSSLESNTTRVVSRSLTSGATRVLAESSRVDAGAIALHPRTRQVEAVAFAPDRSRWTVLASALKPDYEGIAKLQPGDFEVLSRSAADDRWIVRFTSDTRPVRFYMWDRRARAGKLLFTSQRALEVAPLAPMKPVTIPSRDGLSLQGYLTVPPGAPARPLPLVLYVHGGPWARDVWGFEPVVQWLANRGYAVLQVNFRGSTGYGKAFLNAGNREWGGKMQHDLSDAARWAIGQGIAEARQVAIFGGSYGGYATLAGLAFTPELFACGVDIVGPSNLRTLFETIPPYWKSFRAVLDRRVGNIDDPRDAALLRAASPVHAADRIVRPLLIGQGANDPRVKPAESEQIVEAIRRNGGTVEYALYPDEGHGFGRAENRLDFYARAERFLAEHLGGRAEPMAGERQPGSSVRVRRYPAAD